MREEDNKILENEILEQVFMILPCFRVVIRRLYGSNRPPSSIGQIFIHLGHHLQDLIKQNDVVVLKEICNFIEIQMNSGDEDLELSVGLCLDSIQGFCLRNNEFNCGFFTFLGPKSREFCKQLDEFWGTKTPGLWDEDENKERVKTNKSDVY